MAFKLDVLAVLKLVGIAMNVVEQFKTPGKDKQTKVIEAVQHNLADIEEAVGVDFVNDPELNNLLMSYIDARVALLRGIEAAKKLKGAGDPVPVPPVV